MHHYNDNLDINICNSKQSDKEIEEMFFAHIFENRAQLKLSYYWQS
jgi:hypothetical protein